MYILQYYTYTVCVDISGNNHFDIDKLLVLCPLGGLRGLQLLNEKPYLLSLLNGFHSTIMRDDFETER